jgi:hypothetical protein
MPVPFITVEGPIGVGKTSLTKALADQNQFQLLKEIVDENPFLNKFYEDIEVLFMQPLQAVGGYPEKVHLETGTGRCGLSYLQKPDLRKTHIAGS